LSILALNSLAKSLASNDKDLPALHCLAASLYLDRVNPQTLAQMLPLLMKHKFDTESEALAKLADTLPRSSPPRKCMRRRPGRWC
jgi:hypothetical protein